MPERFALFIGNDQYEDQSLARLKTPSADVQGLARAFEDPSIGHFDEVSQLINEADVHVRRAVGKFFSRREPTICCCSTSRDTGVWAIRAASFSPLRIRVGN